MATGSQPAKFPLECLNCDEPLQIEDKVGNLLFCADSCRDFADTIRYARRVTADGRIKDPDVRDALRTRLAFAVSGGYPRRARALDANIRKAVMDRDGGMCVICGSPGTEIDHIAGSSPELGNLQLLCHRCHIEKTAKNFRPIQSGSPQEMLRFELDYRIASATPLRPCDDELQWGVTWRKLSSDRKAHYWSTRPTIP